MSLYKKSYQQNWQHQPYTTSHQKHLIFDKHLFMMKKPLRKLGIEIEGNTSPW